MNIRTKAILAVGSSVVIGIAAMVAVIAGKVFDDARENGYRQVRERADALARQVADRFSAGFEVPRHLVGAVQGMRTQQLPQRKSLDAVVARLLADTPDASGLWMLWEPNALDGHDDQYRADWPNHDPSGRYMPYMTRSGQTVKQDTMLGADQQKEAERFRSNPAAYRPAYEQPGWGDFYVLPKQRGRDTVTEPYPYEVQGKTTLMSSLAVVIKDEANHILGVAGIDLPLGTLQASIGAFKAMEDGRVTLLSNGGLYVVTPDAGLLGKQLAANALPEGMLEKLKSGSGSEYQRDDALHVWRAVPVGASGQNWALGVSVPLDTILARATQARNQALLIGAITILAVLALLCAVLATLTRPLARLADAMEGLAAGEGDLTRRLEVASNDEIGRTSAAFNRFIGNLQQMFLQVSAQSDALKQAAGEVAAASTRVEGAADHQADSVGAMAASVEQVTVSIQHIADTARQLESIAQKAGSDIADGRGKVADVAGEVRRADDSVTALAETMERLGEQSNRVDSIVAVIKAIADQTNLLALNAAIEAARAGEAGRGFAVVADEVRKLAARTAEATVEISRIVTTIQAEIGTADQRVQDTRSRIDQGVALSRIAAKSIDEVATDTRNLVTCVVDIAAATREQAAASTDIAQNVERIGGMTESNRSTVIELGTAVRHLDGLSLSLRGIVARFKL